MKLKEYNPCGGLTGRETEICNAALTSYFNLPFVQVMRNIAIQEISGDLKATNDAAILNWADYNLNEIESQAAIPMENATPAQLGLYKFILHLLFENRYNIEYNRLVNYCEKISADNLEEKINYLAQKTNYNSTFDDMTAELEHILRS